MDAARQKLKRRWDNVPHFPSLPNFPHHVHIEEESNVEQSYPMSIIELINLIESLL